MKIKFLGVGSAFTSAEYYHSNMLVETSGGKRMLFDCGSDIRFSLGECGIAARDLCRGIDAVYISHLHGDHIGGMEWMALNMYFAEKPRKPELIMEGALMEEMWESSLKGGLGCIRGKVMELSDYFSCRPEREGSPFVWEGLSCAMVRLPHVAGETRNIFSFGLVLEEAPGRSAFISSDTRFEPELLSAIGERTAAIFHDCETCVPQTGVHAHYDQLKTLPSWLREKMWLYHYQPYPKQDPVKDGFKGFVAKGGEFVF